MLNYWANKFICPISSVCSWYDIVKKIKQKETSVPTEYNKLHQVPNVTNTWHVREY